MSPLWRDQLRIVLCPDRVMIVRLRKGWRPSIAEKNELRCSPIPGVPAWRAPVDVMAHWLSEGKAKNADVVVILSNHFVRYGVLPWAAVLNDADEEQTFARIHFEKIYGDMARQWALRISDASYESPRLVGAVDQGLLDALSDMSAVDASLRVVSIQPYLMTALNQWRRRLHKQSGLFVLVEPGKACFAKISDGQWLDVKSVSLRGDSAQEWQQHFQREMLLAGFDADTKIFLHAIDHPELELSSLEPMSIETAEVPAFAGISPKVHARFGMALDIGRSCLVQASTLDYVRNRRSRSVPLGMLVAAVLAAGYLAAAYVDLTQEKDRWQTKWAQLQRNQKQGQDIALNAQQSTKLKPELTRASEVIRQLTLPWDGLFKAVEASGYKNVALLSIQPDAVKRSVVITAEAKDLESMFEYVRRLSKELILQDSHLISHQIQQQDPLKPIRFIVITGWRLR